MFQSNIPTYSWAGARGETVSYPFTSLHFNRTDYAGGANISFAENNETVDTIVFSGPRVLAKGEETSFRFQLFITPSQPPNASAHFEQKYLQIGSPTPAPCDKACAEAFIQEQFMEPGYSVLNLHHGSFPLNPYINWPFSEAALPVQTEFADILHRLDFRLKMYFTVGQMSDHVPSPGNLKCQSLFLPVGFLLLIFTRQIEIMALLRSLDGEVLDLCDNSNAEHPTNNEESDAGLCTTEASQATYSFQHPGGCESCKKPTQLLVPTHTDT